jgi:hypothetical protein
MKDDGNIIDLNEAKTRLKAANDYEHVATGGVETDGNDDAEAETTVTLEEIKQRRKRAEAERKAVLKELNEQYAIAYDAGKGWVLKDTFEHAFERKVYHYMRPADLAVLYANRKVTTRIANDGKTTRKPIVKWWIEHSERRQYVGGIIFDPSTTKSPPDCLNLWRGFAIKSKPGSWNKLRDHVYKIVCGGNRRYFDYLVGWMARLAQEPHKAGEVAVVLRGGMGTGKGILGRALRKLLGQHGMQITNSKHLTGNFNAHLRDCVFLFADEAFFAGDKAGIGILRGLITEDVLAIEGKFKDTIQTRNRLHILMASNSEWVVPAALDERRFFVLDVSDAHKQDKAYFGAIQKELDDGGYAAMLHDLLNYDISKFEVRDVPETLALQDQKAQSLPNDLSWWRNVLHRGYVYESKHGFSQYFGEWHPWVATAVLHKSYTEYAKSHNERHSKGEAQFGKFMRDGLGAIPSRPRGDQVVGEQVVSTNNGDRYELIYAGHKPGYQLGTLQEAREKFEAKTGLTSTWDKDDDEQGDEQG